MAKKVPASKSFVPEVGQGSETDSIHRNASWGAIVSIAIILTMVIVGSFYALGQRISEQKAAQMQIQTN